MTDPSLATAFLRYLRSGDVRSGAAPDLPDLLDRAGCPVEAAALHACVAGQAQLEVPAGPLRGQPMHLGPEPPSQPGSGDLWFDRTDLAVMVLVQSADVPSPAMARWVSARPVRAWQFEGFRRAVLIGAGRTEFPSPGDYLARPAVAGPGGWAGDVYQDEALACVHWFGKGLAGQFEWLDARDTLPAPVFDAMLPPGWGAWEEAEYPLSEFVRVAMRRETLDRQPTEEHQDRLAGINAAAPDRMLFEEWDRLPAIGFSTMLWAARGRDRQEPPRTLFFDLRNSVFHPAGCPEPPGDNS